MKVYIVTDGQYSDYRIQAVFSTKALAKEYLAEYNKDPGHHGDIEPWDLDEPVRALVPMWRSQIYPDGLAYDPREVWRWSDEPTSESNRYCCTGYGETPELAHKRAVEALQAFLRRQTEPTA